MTVALPSRPRKSNGEWACGALADVFLHPAGLDDCGADLPEVALVLREIVVSRQAMYRFLYEMGWAKSDQHSFGWVDPQLLTHAEPWLRRAEDILARRENGSPQATVALLAAAYGAACSGASMADVETKLPGDSPVSRAQAAFIRGEWALHNGFARRATREFARFAFLAPHVTAGHRRLGHLALAEGSPRRAARHFEAATAIPNQLWTSADQCDENPVPVGRIGGQFVMYRYRGGLFAVPWTPEFRGIAVVAGRLLQLSDTPAYHLWLRIERSPIISAIRIAFGRLCGRGRLLRLGRAIESLRSSAERRLSQVAQRVPALKWLARRLRRLHGQKKTATDGPGLLKSIYLRLARSFQDTWLSRIAGRATDLILVAEYRDLLDRVLSRARLTVLRVAFRAREVPPELYADTLEELIEQIGRSVARV